MNIRKAVDYSAMFAALGFVMDADLPQMELYCEIGKIVCARSEKGAAVAAAEFLKEQYPDMTGFSPRNVRRMRDFWQLYGGMPELLCEALHLNWTQNMVIMEAELAAEERYWYRMLAGDYTVEQKALEEQIPEKESRLEKLKAASANVNTFVEKAKQYTAIDELTPELLRLFIQRIEVGERTEKYSRSSHQSIRIVYRDIGTVDSAMEQGEAQPRIAPPLREVFELPT